MKLSKGQAKIIISALEEFIDYDKAQLKREEVYFRKGVYPNPDCSYDSSQILNDMLGCKKRINAVEEIITAIKEDVL